MDKNSPLSGKRYVNLLRCSTLKQGDKSIPDQKKVNNAFARQHGMIWVRDCDMPGVSASKTFNRRDLDTLLSEARVLGDFDVLLVHDLSRLTRGGIRHALQVRRQFEKAGVLVISASDNVPEGEDGEFFEAFLHWKNKTFAKQLGRDAARGSRSSFDSGKRPHCAHTPYGFDRLYCGPDSTARYILRQTDQRTRVIIDYTTGNVRETMVADEAGRFIPFQKQRDEISKLIFGSDEAVRAVRLAFKMRYLDGASYQSIARKFNELGVKPFHAAYWHATTLENMLYNPIFLGQAIACRWAYGVHYILGKDQPMVTPVKQSDFEETGRSTVDPIRRARNEWAEREEEHLLNYLDDPEVRAVAKAAIEVKLEKFSQPKPKQGAHLKGTGARGDHRHTPYILRDLLNSKDGDFIMTGRTQGNGEHQRRTYVVKAWLRGDPKASHLSAYVPAAPVEDVVLDVLRHFFQKNLNLESMIAESATKELAAQIPDNFDEASLRSEEKLLFRKANALINASIDPDDDDVTKQLESWKLRRHQIKRQLDAMSEQHRQIDVKAIVAGMMEALFLPADKLDGESRFRLRQLVNAWCQDMRIDIFTRDLEFKVRVPPRWALSALATGHELCIEYNFTREAAFDAQMENVLILGEIRCRSPYSGKPRRQWSHKWAYDWKIKTPSTRGKKRPAA